jgi:integrase
VRPVLGRRSLQQLQPTEIDTLWKNLATKVSPWTRRPLSKTTQRHVSVVFGASLATAERSGLIVVNPMVKTQTKPKMGEVDHGIALDADDLAKLVAGFKVSRFYEIVALAASTGARRNELLALSWSAFDADKRTLRIERALEVTKVGGVKFKSPKTARGKRIVDLDAGVVAMLVAQRRKHQQIMAGIPDGADVNLALVKLPDEALIFPADLDTPNPTFTKTRLPRDLSKNFRRVARKLGFAKVRFHNLRHSHSTILLDAGVPVHRVAARIGDDPATLLRTYAMLTRKTNEKMTDAVNALGTLLLKS